MRWTLVLLVLLGCRKQTDRPDSVETADTAPHTPGVGLDERPVNTTCTAPERPPSGAAIAWERVFPELSFEQQTVLLQAPGDDSRWFVGEQAGRIVSFANEPTVSETTTVLDISDRVSLGSERGLLGIAFDPDFPKTPHVYVRYTGAGPQSRLSRFTSEDGGLTFAADSEEQLLTLDQPYGNHNGGDVHFGPDGMLYLAFGDGGDKGDPLGNGQNADNWFSTLLRIDVHGGSPYVVPDDNPFAGGGGAPEIWAYGLRNPWRFSFDRATGALWTGDVGQRELEEVDLVQKGGNYGWSVMEGTQCYEAKSCDDSGLIPPIAEYDHSWGESVIGGFVYRGQDLPDLRGVYVYADYISGWTWGVFWDEEGAPDPQLIGQAEGVLVTTFGQDLQGELYVSDRTGGIYKMVAAKASSGDPFPQLLSETGCFDTSTLIPYGVHVELWSDGADKIRWMALPEGETIDLEDDWNLPAGTVLIKEFHVEGTLVETRLLVRHEDGGWAGYPYRWLEDGSDAVLVTPGDDVSVGETSWRVPSQSQCVACHTDAAGRSLGLETAQLNGDFTYPNGRVANQLVTLAHIGVLEGDLPDDPAELDAFSDTDTLDERARAYLHVQCAHCHQPGAPSQSSLDLRWHTPLAETAACDVPPEQGDLGVSDARLLAPGEPDRSILLLRMESTGVERMPDVGTAVVDTDGTSLIREWIAGLDGCEPTADR